MPATSKVGMNPDPQQTVDEGLRILARMIVRAYLKKKEEEGRLAKGMRPKKFFEKIQVTPDSLDTNDINERQRLHLMIDEAIDEATRQNPEPHSAPFILARDGIRINLYCQDPN